MSVKKKILLSIASILTALSLVTGIKEKKPSIEELAKARESLKASSSFIITYNKRMVPPRTFIKKGLEGEWDVIINVLDGNEGAIRIPLLWANPLPEDRMNDFKKKLGEELQKIIDSSVSGLKVKEIKLEQFEYDIHHDSTGEFKGLPNPFHRQVYIANIKLRKKI